MIRQVIWDFNGTLLDDVSLCLNIINTMLEKRHLKPLTLDNYGDMFDFPVEKYYRSVGFDMSKEPFPILAQEYMDQYQPASFTCRLREGVPQILDALMKTNVRQVLLSATNRNILLAQVAFFGIGLYFDPILGLDDILGKSKRDLAGQWFSSQTILPEETILVGDTIHDHDVAQRIGCQSILLTGGHNSRARLTASGDRVLDHPAAILDAFFPIGESRTW